MLPITAGQHKNPWFYLPEKEGNDGEMDFFSLGRNLQRMVVDKLYDYTDQANFEGTCKQAWSLFNGVEYKFRAAAVAGYEEEEQIVTPGQTFEDISSFTDRGVRIMADTLGITVMDQARRLECVKKIEENKLQANRLIIDIPVLEFDLFNRLLVPKILVFSRPMPLDFLANEYICERIDSLCLPEEMRVGEQDILRLGARELTVRCGEMTSNGLLQIAQGFLSSKRSINFIRIHLPTPTTLSEEDFDAVGRLLPSVQFLDPKNFLLTRPDGPKTLKFSLANNDLTISEPWMIF